jgi:hypothetical protein
MAFDQQTRPRMGQHRAILKFRTPAEHFEVASVTFGDGGYFLASLQHGSPTLYSVNHIQPVTVFTASDYKNKSTHKSFCFARSQGSNECHVVCGSDTAQVFLWKIPQDIAEHAQNHDTVKVEEPSHIIDGNTLFVRKVCS